MSTPCEPALGSAEREPSGVESAVPGTDTTNWSVVHAAASTDPDRARAALATLAQRYRGAVRAYLMHEKYSQSEAEALAARFFHKLGETRSFESAVSGKDSFRAWLLRSLQEFVRSDPDPTLPSEEPPAALASSPRTALPAIPGYEILEILGVGGEGTVYRAYDARAQRLIALKVLHPQYLENPEVVERFRRSVALVSTLDHPNVVRIYDTGGGVDERPYYAMQLVVGGSLAERQRQQQFRDPEAAARLVIKIARAVHHAHQRGLLHRDISPANVLLDLQNEPYLSDFMATRVRQLGQRSVVGKYAYMAPEVAVGEGGTVDADVYGLAAILYELWTGRPPIEAKSFEDVQRAHASGTSPRPRALVPEIPHDLEAICCAALSRDPSKRHPSAAVFADSLERALAHFPSLWPPVTRKRRAWLWMQRHPLLAVGGLAGGLLLVAADLLTLGSVRALQAEVETQTLRSNAALASAQAGRVLALFQKFAAHAARAAVDPQVRAFLQESRVGVGVPVLADILERAKSFDGMSVFSPDGRMLARYPEPERHQLNKEFRFREYYRCIRTLVERAEQVHALREAPQICVSPAYRGEISGNIEFTVAAPVYAETGHALGFVLLGKHAKNTLGEIEIGDVYQSGQTTAVFGQRGRDRDSHDPNHARPVSLTAVAHPGLFDDQEIALPPKLSATLLQRFGAQGAPGSQLVDIRRPSWEERNYVDPVTGDERLAGFAPVGKTGFVVAVSTPRSKALGASERHIEALRRYALMLNLGFLILVGVALRASLRDTPPGGRS